MVFVCLFLLAGVGPQFLLWYLAGVEQLLSKKNRGLAMLSLSFRLMLGPFIFLVCALWCFQFASFSSIWSGIYAAKRKPRELEYAILSPTFRVFSCVFIYKAQGQNGKSTSIPFILSCWKQKPPILVFFS